jgi:hypothetical protein
MLDVAWGFMHSDHGCRMRLPCHDHPPWPASPWPLTDEELERARAFVKERGWA